MSEESLQRALGVALAYLNRRERTTTEVRQRLERDEADPQVIDAALATLVDQSFVDDARYARMFTEDKRNLQQWGADRIRRSLAEKGIERDLIDAALLEEDTGEAERQRALELLRRRFPEPPRQRKDRDRALHVMLRKGYASEVALNALAAHAHARS